MLCYCGVVCDICITQQYHVVCYCDMGTSFTMMTDKQYIQWFLQFSLDNRTIGETLMNPQSSRSHTIFTLTVESRETTDESLIRMSHLVSTTNSKFLHLHVHSILLI